MTVLSNMPIKCITNICYKTSTELFEYFHTMSHSWNRGLNEVLIRCFSDWLVLKNTLMRFSVNFCSNVVWKIAIFYLYLYNQIINIQKPYLCYTVLGPFFLLLYQFIFSYFFVCFLNLIRSHQATRAYPIINKRKISRVWRTVASFFNF